MISAYFNIGHGRMTSKKPRAGITLKSILGNAERHVGTESKAGW